MTPFEIKSREQARMSVLNNTKVSLIKNKDLTTLNFPYSHYPFPNHPVSAEIFCTIVQCNLNKQKIEKVVNLKCENMVSLKKIMKLKKNIINTQKNKLNPQSSKKTSQTYQFDYEKVQYSLGHILQSGFKQQPQWLKKESLSRMQIKKTLANLVALLYKEGIILFLQFQQIGINYKGVLKVYVAPHILFDDSNYNSKAKILVIKSLDRVFKQIDAKYPHFQKVKDYTQQLKMNDLSIENEIMQIQQSIIIGQADNYNKNSTNQLKFKNGYKELLQNGQKSFNEEEDHFFVASGSTNFDNLQINKKIKRKFENYIFASKTQENLKKQKISKKLLRMQQKNKIDQLTFQIQKIRQKLHYNTDQNNEENLYTEKALKTMATRDKTQIKEALKEAKNNLNTKQFHHGLNKQNKKRKNTLSSINFYNGVVPNQKNINCINIYQQNDKDLKSYYGPTDDMMSVDTYELQIGDDYQMPKIIVSMGLRNSISSNKKRQVSKIGLKFEQTQKESPKVRVHESAGGKNYGYIVNLLKPKFQCKKSDIYEEPQIENEQESKKSTYFATSHLNQSSHKLSFERLKKQTLTVQKNNDQIKIQKQDKPLRVINQFQQDLKTLFGQNRVSFSPCQSHRQSFEKRATIPLSKDFQRNPQVSSNFFKNFQQRSNNKQKTSETINKNYILQKKFKKAIQKTKEVMNVLHQVKVRQNNLSK